MNYPTWSDLNNDSIVPPLGARQAPELGPVAVLVSTEPDLRLLRAKLVDPKTQPFFMSSLMTGHGVSLAGPYIGAPYGVMLLESLIAKGTQKIIVLGWCGALTPDLGIGDLILADSALADEGTSRHYKVLDPDLPGSFADETLSDQLAAHMDASGIRVLRCPVWTTDAIYRETPGKVAWFRNKGAKAVEMECSALFAVAEFRKVAITALLIVSDSLASGEWDPGFRNKTFKPARQSACEAVMAFAQTLGCFQKANI